MANDEQPVFCDICGEQIYDDDPRYELPDGKTVCTSSDCLEDWAADYLKLGSHW